jgi:hypothetical protein
MVPRLHGAGAEILRAGALPKTSSEGSEGEVFIRLSSPDPDKPELEAVSKIQRSLRSISTPFHKFGDAF